MLDWLAVASLLLPRVWLKFFLELRLGCLLEFLLWSANIFLSDLISRPFFPTVPFRCVARFSPAFPHVLFPFRRALLARLLVCSVPVASRVARPTSRPSRFRFVVRSSLDFPCVLCLPLRWAHSVQRSTSVFVGHWVLDDIFCSLGGLYYRLSTVCCVWCLLRWVLFSWVWFVWSVLIKDNRVQW